MAKVKLFIIRVVDQPGHYLVVVNGEGFNGSVGKSVAARIRGDDPWFDDYLFTIGLGGFYHVSWDGTFSLSQTVPGGELNEDWGQDEIYALADVQGLGTFKSNVVTGNF